MFTQCPECLTIFRIGASDLAVARGSVRCSHCNQVFDALRSLADELPEEPIHRLDVHVVLPTAPQLGAPVYRPNPAQSALPFESSGHMRPSRPASPTFTRRRPRMRRTASRWWIVASIVLLLTLAAQVGWAERATWLNNPHIRPWMDRACATLGCRLPLRHDLAFLTLASREIRPHPSVPGALVIAATLRNDASFTQAWPVVSVSLADLDETRIAMRRFRPRDYLGDDVDLASGIAPGASASIVLEVADPGSDAVAFEFGFE